MTTHLFSEAPVAAEVVRRRLFSRMFHAATIPGRPDPDPPQPVPPGPPQPGDPVPGDPGPTDPPVPPPGKRAPDLPPDQPPDQPPGPAPRRPPQKLRSISMGTDAVRCSYLEITLKN